MDLSDALVEFACSKGWTPASSARYKSRLGTLTGWVREQGVQDIEAITALLVRRG
jgi:hypothetical protein